MSRSLAEKAWPSVSGTSLVLIPTGSTEQHGPHLPFETDTTIASAVAHGLAVRLGEGVLVAPALPYGASGEHQSFGGTISIGEDVLASVAIELVRSVGTWAQRVVFVNGHGGNIRGLSRAVLQLRSEQHDVAWLPCAVAGGDAHAGRTETSLQLQLSPDAVDLARAVPGNTEPMSDLLHELTSGGVGSVSPSGVLGDPTGATAAEGALLLEQMIEGALRRLDHRNVDGRGCLTDPGVAG